jgi:hypothetical protein
MDRGSQDTRSVINSAILYVIGELILCSFPSHTDLTRETGLFQA